MTQLFKFLSALAILGTFWLIFLNQFYDPECSLSNYVFLPFPLHLLVLFGIYSVYTVLYRTLNFNNCPEAAAELTEEIKTAKADLKRKGFKF